jgi:hypothetical protein
MQILVQCPKGHKLQVKEEYAGKKIRCPKCQEAVVVPAAEQATEEQAPALVATERERDEDTKPARGEPAGAKRETGAKRQAGRGKLPILVGTGAVVLAALAVAGYLVFKPKPEAGGGSGNDKADVEAVAKQFVEAMRDGKDAAVTALFTEKAREKAAQMKHERMNPGATYQITRQTLPATRPT